MRLHRTQKAAPVKPALAVLQGGAIVIGRIPIDYEDVAEKTGLKAGKLCNTICWGWGVQNTQGLPGPDFAEYKPPQEYEGKPVKSVRIVGDTWEVTV